MIDLILLTASLATFSAGFYAGAAFGKASTMWVWLKSFLP